MTVDSFIHFFLHKLLLIFEGEIATHCNNMVTKDEGKSGYKQYILQGADYEGFIIQDVKVIYYASFIFFNKLSHQLKNSKRFLQTNHQSVLKQD